jgi:hypothetical protein
MKTTTENNKLKPINTFGSFLTAGLLIFGAASCNQEGGNQETVETEQAFEEDLSVESTRTNDPVTNTATDQFNQFDSNTDQQWDRDEFNTGMSQNGSYNAWDTDRDGSINENEYNEGMRNWQNQNMSTQRNTTGNPGSTTDNTGTSGTTNNAGTTGTNETTGTTTNTAGTFQDWDTDRNGTINQDEYNQGAFSTWDADRNGTLSSDEYNRGVGTGTTTGTGTNNTGTGTDNTGTGTGTGGTGTGTGTDGGL